jgi:streptogramin lyase
MLQSWKRPSVSLCLILLAGLHSGIAAEQKGVVLSGDTPIALSTVKLFSAGRSNNAQPTLLGSSRTDAKGAFAIDFSTPSDSQAVLYLFAENGSPATNRFGIGPSSSSIRLVSVIGPQALAEGVVINERTTVAAAYALAQFTDGAGFAGPSPGLQNAAATVWNLVNPVTGDIGSVLGNSPNGLDTSTMREFNSLANMLASCVSGSTALPCITLFALADPPKGAPPKNTFQAALNIAHNPWLNPQQLFLQSLISRTYKPALLQAPDAWTIAIAYNGNGHEFDGPGNLAFDKTGAVWITNNYVYAASPFTSVCGDTHVIKLTPTGVDAPGAPYSGGGLYGAGFGIAVDPSGKPWVSNFGFQGSQCPNPIFPEYKGSVSEFTTDGVPLSPNDSGTPPPFDGGFTKDIAQPQGTAADMNGNVWIANCGSDSVSEYINGNGANEVKFSLTNLVSRPFGIATDGDGNAWVGGTGNSVIFGLSPNGTPLLKQPFSDKRIIGPMGIAVDSEGNVWTSNSGGLGLPCNGNTPNRPGGTPSVAKLTRTGKNVKASVFYGGGITFPWGIAIDGNDNIFVANFGGQRLSEFCGVRTSNCPPGTKTGDPISPDTGYTSDALTRNTGVAIDPSGNVWLANNWLNVPIQTNPGGHGAVVFIGLAAPIKTPLNGPPSKP